MRRKDREVLDTEIIRDFLESSNIVRIAFNTGAAPYIVPLGYGFDYDGKELTLYMHGSKDGRKVDLAEQAPEVGFEIDYTSEVHLGETAKDTSIDFVSIIGTGYLHILKETEEIEHCFNRIMYQFMGKDKHDYEPIVFEITTAFKLSVDSFTMKKS